MHRYFFLFLLGVFLSHPLAVFADWDSKQKSATMFGLQRGDYGSEAFEASLLDATEMGIDSVTLLIAVYQETHTSSEIMAGPRSPYDDALRSGIAYAQSLGLDVYLSVHVETDRWRAEIVPADRDAWFANYGNVLKKYAAIAQMENVTGFILGTELYEVASVVANPDNEQQWETLIDAVESLYDGQISYSAQHSGGRSELFEVAFWDRMDFIGISAYYDLRGGLGDSEKEKILSRWSAIDRDYVYKAFERYGKSVVFTELGYRNIESSYGDPWNAGVSRSMSEASQNVAYDALISYWSDKSYFNGWHVWAFETDLARTTSPNTLFTPQGKAAEDLLRTEWSGSTVASRPAGHLYGTSPEGWAYCPRESTPFGTWDNLINHGSSERIGCYRSALADMRYAADDDLDIDSGAILDKDSESNPAPVTDPVAEALPLLSQNGVHRYCLSSMRETAHGWSNFILDGVQYDCIFRGSVSDNPKGDKRLGYQPIVSKNTIPKADPVSKLKDEPDLHQEGGNSCLATSASATNGGYGYDPILGVGCTPVTVE